MKTEPVETYLALVTSEHRKPKFLAMLTTLAGALVDAQVFMASVADSFDLDTAIGSQLDKIGEWIGISRRVAVGIPGVYFTWGDPDLGWGRGVWKDPADPGTTLNVLPDDVFKTLLRAKIAANKWDGTIPGIYAIWDTVFESEGTKVIVQDNQDMTMIVGIADKALSALMQALLSQGYLPLKPAGVGVTYYVATIEAPLFSWGCNNSALAGWGTGTWGKRVI